MKRVGGEDGVPAPEPPRQGRPGPRPDLGSVQLCRLGRQVWGNLLNGHPGKPGISGAALGVGPPPPPQALPPPASCQEDVLHPRPRRGGVPLGVTATPRRVGKRPASWGQGRPLVRSGLTRGGVGDAVPRAGRSGRGGGSWSQQGGPLRTASLLPERRFTRGGGRGSRSGFKSSWATPAGGPGAGSLTAQSLRVLCSQREGFCSIEPDDAGKLG